MAALQSVIGEKVVDGNNEQVDSAALTGEGKVLGIYFSAHWCPPCRAFTPQLAQWYKNFKDGPNGSKFDIVFVSSDRDEKSFKDYFKEMPWLALPYEFRDKKAELSRKFKVSGIPTLVFVNAENGQLITADGRAIVMEDTEGKDFPWAPKPFKEIIAGKFINKDKEESSWDDVKGKALGVYFSAHWCGPCRVFTPQLVRTYNKLKSEGKAFEIIFCSSDRDEDAMMEYLGEMPWIAIPFGDGRKKALSRLFDVSGIPTLVILDENGQIITAQGRGAISVDPEGKDFPWHPKPVNELTGATASDINDYPSLMWFTDGQEDSMENAKKELYPIAEEHFQKCKSEGSDEYRFYVAGEDDDDDIVNSLRRFAKLPSKTPLLVIIDIPSQKVFVCEEDEVNDGVIRRFLEGHAKKEIIGKALGQ